MQYTGKSLWDFTQEDFDVLLEGFRVLGQPVLQGAKVTPGELLFGLNSREIVEGYWGKQFTPHPYDAPNNKLFVSSGYAGSGVHAGIELDPRNTLLERKYIEYLQQNFLV